MRAAIIAMMILLLPAALFAGGSIGVYFTYIPGQMHYSPTPFEQFTGYVYAFNSGCFLDAAEFRITVPAGLVVSGFGIPEGSLSLGDPINPGLSVTYWPPLSGFDPGYNLLCTLNFFAPVWCYSSGGTLIDAPIAVVPTLDSGLLQYSCWPENYLVPFTPYTSILCPEMVGTQDASWGAIKSLF